MLDLTDRLLAAIKQEPAVCYSTWLSQQDNKQRVKLRDVYGVEKATVVVIKGVWHVKSPQFPWYAHTKYSSAMSALALRLRHENVDFHRVISPWYRVGVSAYELRAPFREEPWAIGLSQLSSGFWGAYIHGRALVQHEITLEVFETLAYGQARLLKLLHLKGYTCLWPTLILP